MRHLLLILLVLFLTACVHKTEVYDPFSRVKLEDIGSWYKDDPVSPDLMTPERRQIDSFRYWNDMEEAEELISYQGLSESYRFIFWGDHEPYILVRINHWGWSNKYSISLRVRMRDAYNSTSCIFDPKQLNPLDCPKTDYIRKENYEITAEQWQEFKEKLSKLNFFNYKPSSDENRIFIMHGTLWSFEGILETENDILENRFEVNTPPDGELYQVGKYLLEFIGEQKWLSRTKR